MIKVSVLIPCYNVEKYVVQCLDSAEAQSLQETEIICINDGSTDSTLDIIRQYAKKYSNIVVIDKPNAGYGHTMNVGIRQAKGEYIAFLESDDFIEPAAYQELYEAAAAEKLDIIKADYYEITGEGENQVKNKKVVSLNKAEYGRVFRPADHQEAFYFAIMNCLGLFRRDFLIKNSIFHNETPGASHQDVGFWFLTLSLADRMKLLDKPFYYYRKDNENSSIHDLSKVYNIFDEYTFARERLERTFPAIWKKVLPVFWHRFYGSTKYTFDHIENTYKRDYIKRISTDFQSVKPGSAEARRFSEAELSQLETIVADPELYYFTKFTRIKKTHYIESSESQYTTAISVIMPVYNTQPWLRESIDSILSQSFKDFELICIDDESTDESYLELLRYERLDPRIKVCRIEHNGQGAARQEGIRQSIGRYIYFFDSDDLLEKDALEKMYALAEERKTDILLFDGSIFFDSDISEQQKLRYKNAYKRYRSYSDVVSGEELFTRMSLDNLFSVSPCLMFINHAFLDRSGVEFVSGSIYEDNLFAAQIMMSAERASHENLPLFKRRLRSNSTVTHSKNEYDYVSYFYILTKLLAFIVENDFSEDTVNQLLKLAAALRYEAIKTGKQLKNLEKAEQMIAEKGLQYTHIYNTYFRQQVTGNSVSFVSDEEMIKEMHAIRSSWAFRIGRMITYIPHQIKKAITGHH